MFLISMTRGALALRVISAHALTPLLMTCAVLMTCMTLAGCDDGEGGSPAPDLSLPDAAPACALAEGDCPNACEHGVGVLGERCADTTSCGCGLFCDEGRCAPYRGEHLGCLCDGEGRAPLAFADACSAETEGAPCNDRNPCTLDDACSRGVCVGRPTEFPASCDDGSSCTTNDVCAGAVCQGQEKADGERCDDGDLCTTADLCARGACVGEVVECDGSGDQCNLGVCDPRSGACVARPKPAGEPCSDGDYCTLNDACSNGLCVASERVDCSGQETECLSAVCDPLSGACLRAPRPDGQFCDSDESACTQERCEEGACVIAQTVRCDLLCNDGLCDPETGRCTGEPLADGTPCDDQDACTQNNTCRGGVCFVEALLCACDGRAEGALCDDNNPCTREARCDASGQCVALGSEPAGVACEVDGDLCTRGGSCDGAGACVGEVRLDCEAALPEVADAPCLVARCAPERGVCVASPVADETPCDTGRLCDAQGACASGVCVAPPKACHDLDEACAEGVCEPSTGACVRQPFPVGTPCEDGDLCTGAARCEAGGAGGAGSGDAVCAPQTAVDLCDACAGRRAGDPCDDGDLCTASSACLRRGVTLVCLGASKVCGAEDEALLSEPLGVCEGLLCDPTSGACVPQALPVGSPCDDGALCTLNDRCVGDVGGELSCVGEDLQREVIECPEGASLLNPTAVDQRLEDLGLVDTCADINAGQNATLPHDVDALAPGDPSATLLSQITEERPTEWFSLSLEAPSHLRAWVSDRCGRPAPFTLSLIHPSTTRDLTGAERAEALLDPSLIAVDVPQAGRYFLQVELTRSLAPGERGVPYVLHVQRSAGARCAVSLDCCAEERCAPIGEGGGLQCEPVALREGSPNQRPSEASRLLFLNTPRARALGALSDREEEDWFKVRLSAQHTYDISVEGHCGHLINTHLSLYHDPSALPVASNDDRADARASELPLSPQIAGVIPSETMDMYLKVKLSPNAQEAPFGYYSLIVDDVSCRPSEGDEGCGCSAKRCLAVEGEPDLGQCVPRFPEREPNQTLAESQSADNDLSLDTPSYGQIERVGDRDLYLIDLPAGRFSLETRAYCDRLPVNTSLRVMSLGGLTLARDDDGGEGRLSLISGFEVSVPQRYLVEVSGEGASLGPYLLSANTLELGGGGGPVSGQCDSDQDCQCADLMCALLPDASRACVPRRPEREPNGRRAEASDLALGERVTGAIDTIGDVDVFRVSLSDAERGESVVFFLDPACDGLGVDARIRLLDPDGVTLLTSEAWSRDHMAATPPLEVLSAAVYYLEVRGGVGARGAYIISSERVAPDVYTPLSDRACYRDEQCLCEALRCDALAGSEGRCVARGAREVEPNDALGQGRLVVFDALGVAQVSGALSGAGDQDSYLIDIGPAQRWSRFEVEVSDLCGQPTPPLTRLEIYDPNGALVATREGVTPGALTLSPWTPYAQGLHTLVVSYAEGASVSAHGAYQLTLSPEGSCDLDPTISLEREPNDLATLAQRLSSAGRAYLGGEVYGRLDQLGDLDRYSFTFTPDQRGALFSLSLSPLCEQYELPLSRRVEHAGLGVTLLSESAAGEPTEGSARPSLGAGVLRVEGPLPHLLTLALAPLSADPVPQAGEYLLELSEVSCQEDLDCACEQVGCVAGACRVRHDEVEPNGAPALAAPLSAPRTLAGVTLSEGSGFISPPTQGLPDHDYWALPPVTLGAGEALTVRVTLSPFCEAPLLDLLPTLYEEGGTISAFTQITAPSAEGKVSYEATTSASGAHALRLSAALSVGAYHLSVELRAGQLP
jgi:hypothetical protein